MCGPLFLIYSDIAIAIIVTKSSDYQNIALTKLLYTVVKLQVNNELIRWHNGSALVFCAGDCPFESEL